VKDSIVMVALHHVAVQAAAYSLAPFVTAPLRAIVGVVSSRARGLAAKIFNVGEFVRGLRLSPSLAHGNEMLLSRCSGWATPRSQRLVEFKVVVNEALFGLCQIVRHRAGQSIAAAL
jgi:hypothetical protein